MKVYYVQYGNLTQVKEHPVCWIHSTFLLLSALHQSKTLEWQKYLLWKINQLVNFKEIKIYGEKLVQALQFQALALLSNVNIVLLCQSQESLVPYCHRLAIACAIMSRTSYSLFQHVTDYLAITRAIMSQTSYSLCQNVT